MDSTPHPPKTSKTSKILHAQIPVEVLQGLPQRPPFLFVDKIIAQSENRIQTEKVLTGNEDFFKGHFPGMPIMPGVLLCEAVFQTGALLVGKQRDQFNNNNDNDNNYTDKDTKADSVPHSLGVVTRIESTKFKNFVRPGDTLQIEVELKEHIQNAYYMKGSVSVAGEKVMTTSFTCALVPPPTVSSPSPTQQQDLHE